MRKHIVLVFLVTLSAQGWAREKSIEEMGYKASHLSRLGREAYEAGDCKKSLKSTLQVIALAQQINEFGGHREYAQDSLEAANCYADAGDKENAVKYYSLAMGNSSSDLREMAAQIGTTIGQCAVCRYNLIQWDSLAHLYQLMGDSEKAGRAKTELRLHTQANNAYRKEERKGSGMHMMDFIGLAGASAAAYGAGRSGTAPPDASEVPHSDTDAEMAKATNRAWYAKMTVYKNANRPEYVAQVVQEMRNRQ